MCFYCSSNSEHFKPYSVVRSVFFSTNIVIDKQIYTPKLKIFNQGLENFSSFYYFESIFITASIDKQHRIKQYHVIWTFDSQSAGNRGKEQIIVLTNPRSDIRVQIEQKYLCGFLISTDTSFSNAYLLRGADIFIIWLSNPCQLVRDIASFIEFLDWFSSVV